MTLPKKVDVVVVGAGPTGLTLACTLRAAGHDVLVLDQLPQGANTSRAAVIHARTLEVLDELDITPRLVAEGCVVPIFTVRDRQRVLARLDFSNLPTPYPYTLMLPQSRTEAILADRLAELDGRVHRPWTVTSVDNTTTGGVVTASDATGVSETVEARYVVGADGLNSVVRTGAGIGFSGDHYTASFVLADIQLDWPLPTEEVQLFFSPGGLVVVAPLPGGRHRIVATVDQAPETPSAGLIQSLLDERGPRGAHVGDLGLVLPLPSPAPGCRHLPKRLTAPGRRRGPRPQSSRRARDEHRHPGRGRPRPHPHRRHPRPSWRHRPGWLPATTTTRCATGSAANRPRDPAGHTARTCPTPWSQPGHRRRQPNPRSATAHRHPDR